MQEAPPPAASTTLAQSGLAAHEQESPLPAVANTYNESSASSAMTRSLEATALYPANTLTMTNVEKVYVNLVQSGALKWAKSAFKMEKDIQTS